VFLLLLKLDPRVEFLATCSQPNLLRRSLLLSEHIFPIIIVTDDLTNVCLLNFIIEC